MTWLRVCKSPVPGKFAPLHPAAGAPLSRTKVCPRLRPMVLPTNGGCWPLGTDTTTPSCALVRPLPPVTVNGPPRTPEGAFVTFRSTAVRILVAASALAVLAACGSSGSSSSSSGSSGGKPVSGGDLVIARTADSQSMNNTTVFDNESIWVFEQIFQTLYTVTPNGKGVTPELATSYKVSADKKTYTFTLRKGVKFSNGTPMTAADVVFSIDQAKAASQGWGYIDTAIKSVSAPDAGKVA